MTFSSESRASAAAVPFLAALPRLRAISPLVVALAAILLVLIVPPALFLLNISLHETRPDGSLGGFTLRFYRGLFSERLFLASLRNTLIYAFGSAVIAIVIGTVQALIVERTNTPGRQLAFFGAIISLGVPHILYVVAWLLLLGRAGPVNDAILYVTQHAQALERLLDVGHGADRGRRLRAADLSADVGGVALDGCLVRGGGHHGGRQARCARSGASRFAWGCRRYAALDAAVLRARVRIVRSAGAWLGSPATSMC